MTLGNIKNKQFLINRKNVTVLKKHMNNILQINRYMFIGLF